MEIYNFHSETGEYLGMSAAIPDPLEEGKYLIPAHATDLAPPPVGSNESAVFEAEAWLIKPDYRGQTYYDTTSKEEINLTLGQAPDATMTDIVPDDPESEWVVDHWELPLDILKQRKREELSIACEQAIESGIDNNALGTTHHYPTTKLDQQNMNGIWSTAQERGIAGEPYKFWCDDGTGAWARRNHTAAQLSTAALAVADHVIVQQDKYETKLAEVDAAVDQAALDLVIW